jgi:hypothetical protein
LDPESGQWERVCDTGLGSQFAFVATSDALYFTRGPQLLTMQRPEK